MASSLMESLALRTAPRSPPCAAVTCRSPSGYISLVCPGARPATGRANGKSEVRFLGHSFQSTETACTTTPEPGGSSGKLLLAPGRTRTGKPSQGERARPKPQRNMCILLTIFHLEFRWFSYSSSQRSPDPPCVSHVPLLYTHIAALSSSAGPHPSRKTTPAPGAHGQLGPYSISYP